MALSCGGGGSISWGSETEKGVISGGFATTQANDIIAAILSYADSAVNRAIGLDVETDTGDISQIVIPDIISDPIDFMKAYEALDYLLSRLPELPTFDEVPTGTPTMGDLEDTPPELQPIDIPDFDKDAPALTIPETPDWVDYTAPDAPETQAVSTPVRPDITYPDEPNLSDIVLPDPYIIDYPTFDETLLDEDLLAPSNTFAFNEEAYSSALLDAVKSGLLDEILNGGYGLHPNDETLLFNRERERELEAANAAVEEATRLFSLNGFPMPTGAMQKAIQRARQEANNKVSSVNRDITLRRSELLFEGKKFAYSQAVEVEKMLTTLHNAVWERALNAAKAEIQVAIDIFNAVIERYKAKQERYRTMADVFKTRVEAERAKIESYKAELDAAKTRVDINTSLVDLYRARMEGVKIVAEVYRTDAEVSRILMEIEKQKIDIYRAEVEAFVARVQAKASEFEAFRSAVQGETAKVEAFKAEADAFSAIVDGKRGKIEADKLRLEAFVQRNEAVISKYNAESKANEDVRQAILSKINAQVEQFKAQVTGFDAEAQAVTQVFDLAGKQKELEYRSQIQALEVNIQTAKIELEKVIRAAEIQVEAIRTKGQVYSALASAALSAMNVNTSLSDSYSEHLSQSESWSTAKSESSSRSVSCGHSWQEFHQYEH